MRTDLDIVNLPAVPNFGGLIGKNVTQTDPDFNSKIVRLTDASDNRNGTLETSDSGNANIWNKDDTLILVRAMGGANLLYEFNPSSFKGKNLGIRILGKVSFSAIKRGIIYQVDGSKINKITYRKLLGVWKLATTTEVCDFANILPSGFNINWTGSFGVSEDDGTFTVGFSEGAQNSAFLCCVFRVGFGYRLLNTATGTISGTWGETGQAVITSPDTSLPFTMHECSQTPNPDYANIGAFNGGSSPLFWEIPTLDLRDRVITGHAAAGYLHSYAGGPGGGQLKEVLYSDPTQTRNIVPKANLPASQVPPQKYDGDAHYGFGKLDKLDNSIIWVSSQAGGLFGAPVLGSLSAPFTSCWMNEIRGYDSQTGVVSRACHTFNSGKAVEFIASHSMGVPSQTGRFVAFTSDMMGSLGSTSGQPQGTLGIDCRADVFIVKVG